MELSCGWGGTGESAKKGHFAGLGFFWKETKRGCLQKLEVSKKKLFFFTGEMGEEGKKKKKRID